MHFNLEQHTILVAVGGSKAYGMHTATSDLDLKGVCISPKSVTLGFVHGFEQADDKRHMDTFHKLLNEEETALAANGLEGTVYDLRKFMGLARKGNPNILEVLFCSDEGVKLVTKEGELLRENASLFLSQAVRYSYTGYAVAQLKRIKGHRNWLLDPKNERPERRDFGLLENPEIDKHTRGMIEAKVRQQLDRGFEREEALKLCAALFPEYEYLSDPNWVAKLNAEYAFGKAMEEWTKYQEWMRTRNVKRAELEAKYGYDTKHAAHLVRLLRTGHELLTTGKLHVKRPDAEELLAIRNGLWTYDGLIEWADRMVALLDDKSIKSVLPHSPDQEKLNELCVKLHESFYERTKDLT
jgi:predicted nucleotidyltransferase